MCATINVNIYYSSKQGFWNPVSVNIYYPTSYATKYQNNFSIWSNVCIACLSSSDNARTRFCTQLGTLLGVAQANLGLNRTRTTKNASKIKAKTRPSIEVKCWIKRTELRAWIMTSKRVPKTKSNWLKRPRSQSKDDQETTRFANQL